MRIARLLLLMVTGALLGYGCLGSALLWVMQRGGPSGDEGFDRPYYVHGAWIGALIGYVIHRCWPK